MSTWTVPGAVFGFGSTVFLFGVFLYLYIREHRQPLFWLTIAWGLYGVRYVIELLEIVIGSSTLERTLIQVLVILSANFLVLGTHTLTGRRGTFRLTAVSLVAVVFVIGFSFFPGLNLASTLLAFAFTGSLYIWIGVVFLGVQSEASIGSRATAVLFILWGLHKFDYPFLRQHPVAAGWGFLLAALLGMGTAISILLHYLDVSKNALVRSEKLYRLLSERAHDMIFRYTFDPSPSFEYVSPSSTTLVGYSPEEHYADPSLAGKIVHPDDRAIFTSIPQSNTGDIRTFRVIHRDGRVIWLEQLSTILRNEKGRTIAVEGTIRDVSTRVEREEMLRRGEEHLHSAVREKDTLLQELHHLVNNNLAIILSLVDFEMRKYGGAVMPALRKIQRRVMSVALIHSLLYNGKDSRSLDFRQYCQSLVEHIRVTYPKPSARHEIVVSIAAGNLDIDRAKSCGLIISELVPNALEHAFGTGETQGRVEVTFSCESERCTLVVCDNGCGFPPDFDWRRKTNSGLFIVSSLCDQLDAHMNIQSTPGLRVEVSFPRKGR